MEYLILAFFVLPFMYCFPLFILRYIHLYNFKLKDTIPYIIFNAVVFETIYAILDMEIDIPLRTVFALISIAFSTFVFLKANLTHRLIALITSAVLLLISEAITLIIVTRVLSFSSITVKEKSMSLVINFITFLLPYILTVLYYKIKKQFNFENNREAFQKYLSSIAVIIFLIFSLLMAFRVEMWILKFPVNEDVGNTIFYAIGFFGSAIVVGAIYIKSSSHEKEKNEQLLMYQETLQNLYNGTVSFKHNHKNFLLMLKGYYKEKDYEGLGNLINELEKEHFEIYSFEGIESLVNIKETGLKWLLTSKITVAQNFKIRCTLTISDNFEQKQLTAYHFNQIIGILFDNAIDAAKESRERRIDVSMTTDALENKVIIKNTFLNPPDISKIFEHGYSTKPKHTGVGLYDAKKIMSAKPDIFYETKINDDLFIFKISFTKIDSNESKIVSMLL